MIYSDSLTGDLNDSTIASVLVDHAHPQTSAESLVEAAARVGGHDDITVIVVDGGTGLEVPGTVPGRVSVTRRAER